MRLNTNESPLPPPKGWYEALQAGIAEIPFNRYPDREATELRAALADQPRSRARADLLRQRFERGAPVPASRLRRARAGAPRSSSRPTPCTVTSRGSPATEVAIGSRGESFELDLDEVRPGARRPRHRWSPSSARPNNPTGRAEPPERPRGGRSVSPRACWSSTRPTASSRPGPRSSWSRTGGTGASGPWWSAPSPRPGRWRPAGSAT